MSKQQLTTAAESTTGSSSSVWTRHAVWIGLLIRCLVAWLLPLLMDTTQVPYTDIDYYVFTDAAAHVAASDSPYDRTTYRYTPFLASLLARLPSFRFTARYLFCIADTLCGYLIVLLLRKQRQRESRSSAEKDEQHEEASSSTAVSASLQDCLWWLYNPLVINICTRGSAESLVVLLPVLLTVYIVATQKESSRSAAAVAAGITQGVAMHAKLYPVIYTLSFLTAFCDTTSTRNSNNKFSVFDILMLWMRRILTQPAAIMFGLTSVVTFATLTYAAVHYYGQVALEEGLLYHFSRVDHRHNYSMHWYWIYLARAHQTVASATGIFSMATAGRLLLIPQLVLLVYTSLGIAPHNLSLALFVQTFLFVAHNKVITAQYFTWYLCLLPLCANEFSLKTRRVQTALVLLVCSILFWLGSAYCLEMQGMAVHRIVWMASVFFFAANTNLLGALLASTAKQHHQKKQQQTHSKIE